MVLSLLVATFLTDAIDVSVTTRPELKKGLPTVHVHILEPIMGFQLKLKRSDGKEVDVKGGGKPGVTRDIELPQPEGKFSYQGELSVNFKNGTSSAMPLQFDSGKADVRDSETAKLDKSYQQIRDAVSKYGSLEMCIRDSGCSLSPRPCRCAPRCTA